MTSALAPRKLGLLALLRRTPAFARLTARLMRDHRVSVLDRGLVVAAVLYAVMPLDFVPDVIPLLGQADDLVFLGTALTRLFDRAPAEAIHDHWPGQREDLSPTALAGLVTIASWFAGPFRRRRLRRLQAGR